MKMTDLYCCMHLFVRFRTFMVPWSSLVAKQLQSIQSLGRARAFRKSGLYVREKAF